MLTVELPVTNGKPTLVDSDIAEKLKGKKLNVRCQSYISFWTGNKSIYLHRFVMGSPSGKVVDHINGDVLDNRRENLRICTVSENSMNRVKDTCAKSGYRLVYKKHCRKNFFVQMKLNHHAKYFFSSYSRHIAGILSDQILVKIVGSFVKKNFPEKITYSELSAFIDKTNGRIFRVVFSRRSDGVQREMLCRTGVHSRHNGGTIPFDPSSRGLYSVYDVKKKSYRFIPLENVICLRFAKTNFRVVA